MAQGETMKVFTINGPKLANIVFAFLCTTVIVYVGFLNNQAVVVTATVRPTVPVVLVVDNTHNQDKVNDIIEQAKAVGYNVVLAHIQSERGGYNVLDNIEYVKFVTMESLQELIREE